MHRALKAIFRPEFLNRIDEIVVFDELSKDELTNILEIMLSELSEMLENKGIKLSVDENVKSFLVEEALKERLGARPLRRLIGRKIEDKLSDIIIRGSYKENLFITMKNGEIICE